MSDVQTASDHAFSAGFTVRIKFDLCSGSGGFVDYSTAHFMDDAILGSKALFSLELGNMEDEANDYFVLLEEAAYISPSGLNGADCLPASIVTGGENILERQRVGQT